MNQAQVFGVILQRNQGCIEASIDSLTHSESLLQLPGQSNCMNWILGHINVYRDGILACIDGDDSMSPSEIEIYEYGSDPIVGDSKSVRFERLVELQGKSFSAVLSWLENLPDGVENQEQQERGKTKGYCGYFPTMTEHLAQMLGHESIHVGELNALRELALVHRGKGWHDESKLV